MQSSRIAELLGPFVEPETREGLTERDFQCISMYIDMLRRWNSRINLTAIRDPEEIVTRHFGESLFAAKLLFPHRAATVVISCNQSPKEQSGIKKRSEPVEHAVSVRLADLGSGAGFPGIPIKLWAPGIGLTLIESNHKKATFLREVVRALDLADVEVKTVRAETIAPDSFGIVTLRAVERLVNMLPVAANLVAPSGELVLFTSEPQSRAAIKLLPSMTIETPLRIPNSESRMILVAHKNNPNQSR
jgi:16S rRNA (guanine527-N7)-methyltransferase